MRGIAKSATAVAAAGPSKPTPSGAALDANLQNKRKREALGEVTNNDKNKHPSKETSKDGKAKPHVLITHKPVRPTIKAPVRKTRTTSVVSSKATENQEEEQHDGEDEDENAMVVDEPIAEPAPALHRVTRRLATRASTTVVSAPATRRLTKNSNGNVVPPVGDAIVEKEQVEDEDAHRAFKRRRTSSEADVEAVVDAQLDVEPEEDDVVPTQKLEVAVSASKGKDEEAAGWDDLDKDDFDDPYMVSEYVVDIFKYLSECEVSESVAIMETSVLSLGSLDPDAPQPQLHAAPNRVKMAPSWRLNGLPHRSSSQISHATRDPLSDREHYRPVLIHASRITLQVAARRSLLPSHCFEIRGDMRSIDSTPA